MKISKRLILTLSLLTIVSLLLVIGILKSKSFQFYGGIVYRFDVEEKLVALTFDDGPSEKYTSEVLSVLEEENIKATFFLVGQEMEKNPNAVKRIIESGHEIGNHSYNHERLIFKPLRKIRNQIETTDQVIRNSGYEKEILFRPPYGQTFIVLPKYLKEQGRPTIMYDISVENFRFQRTKEEMIKHVVANVQPGSNIVFHVMTETRDQEREALKPIIRMLKEKGYKFDTVSNLLTYSKQVRLE